MEFFFLKLKYTARIGANKSGDVMSEKGGEDTTRIIINNRGVISLPNFPTAVNL